MPDMASSRTTNVTAGALAILGSVLFLYGGSSHPGVNSDMGVLGSELFYRHFIEEIVRTPHWERLHTMILAGPLFWAVALAGFGPAIDAKMRPVWQIAAQALAIGATVWTAALVLDGSVTVMHARAFAAATSPTIGASIMYDLVSNQEAVARFGTVSWFAISFAMAMAGVPLTARFHAAPKRAMLGALGVAIGAWSMVSCLNGEFSPAPFTSRYWAVTAIVTGLWFAVLGATMIAHRADGA